MKAIKKVYAILQEPASYTIDRNRAVYDKLGIEYCYINAVSHARNSDDIKEKSLMELSFKKRFAKLQNVLRHNDIVIINGYSDKIFIILFLINFFYRKSIGIDSDTQLRIPDNFFKRIVKRIYLKWVFTNPRIFGLPGGSGTHKDLFRYYGMKDNHIFLMPMMVDNERFCSRPRKYFKPFVFLFVGRIIKLKNIDLMIDAFIKAFGNDKNIKLRIVGEGEELNYLQTKFKNQTNIDFAGARFGADLRMEYDNAHVFVLPSTSEQWGLVVNEAMAAGLPVIVSDKVGAAFDLVEGYNTGFIFNSADVDALSKSMKQLVNDRQTYFRYAENAYHRLNDEWNYDFYRECLEKFIKSV